MSEFQNADDPGDEIVADLRRAWNELDATPSLRGLAEEDHATRETVLWMRAAYASLKPSTVRQPQESYLLRTAAAAILLVAGIFALRSWSSGEQSEFTRTPPRILSTPADRIVMQAGRVRLTLVTKLQEPREDK